MYRSLEACIIDLEKNGQLIRITETVDPELEMASIHLRVHEMKGPAILFENIKGTKYKAISNLFGTLERSKFIFRHTWDDVQKTIALRNNPLSVLKKPLRNIPTAMAAYKALPQKTSIAALKNFEEINIEALPLIKHWAQDGGAFVTLPQVYTEDLNHPGIMHSNLGMYRIQLTGNDYNLNKEIGLHYQIHRGIGVHQSVANEKGKPLKVSIFVGGHPAHTLAAVMPLPEGLSELTFAGLLAGRRFHYCYDGEGFCISNDADFVITGEVFPGEVKPEGPFGDHLGYYSLAHPFPVMKVRKVYAKQNAIWPFTVVGRPPQEDTAFGTLIHELTGNAIQQEIPGIKEVHAVDAAGVHPLLFAIGSERYTPYLNHKQPAEILTQANRILGTGQLSLAKFLFIAADDTQQLSTYNEQAFLQFILERTDLKRDVHFYTNTTIDTLDYSGSGLNTGSKVVLAAYGDVKRTLCNDIPACIKNLSGYTDPQLIIPGIIALQAEKFTDYDAAQKQFEQLNDALRGKENELQSLPLIIVCDNSSFTARNIRNFLWVTFTRSNPSHDIYGVNSITKYKHWGCSNLIIDARIKPHHAPPLELVAGIEKKTDRLFEKGGSLYGLKAG